MITIIDFRLLSDHFWVAHTPVWYRRGDYPDRPNFISAVEVLTAEEVAQLLGGG